MAVGEELKTSMTTPNKLVSITYPRHGLHFLKENLTNKIGDTNIYFQHGFTHHTGEAVGSDDLILTVVRRPEQAIASKIIAGIEINQKNKELETEYLPLNFAEEEIKIYSQSYVDTYEKLNTYKNLMVVDFDGFIKSPLYVFQYILANLKVDKSFDNFIMPKSDESFIASSKVNEFYDYYYDLVLNNNNINKATDAYYMLSKRLYSNIDHN